jgi:predicted permease
VTLLAVAVGCALAVACANVASLLLTRSLSRRRELAIRAALGGGRWRLTRQLLTEHLLLGLAAGIISIAPAWWGMRLLASYQLEELKGADLAHLGGPVLVFNFLVALLTGVLCGVVPAWLAWKHDVNATLKGSPNVDAGTTQQRFRAVFVAGQLAVTVVLLVLGGLMLRSFLGVLSKSPGYDAAGVLTMRVALSPAQYATPERQVAFFDRVVEGAGSLPGVRAASATEELPTSDSIHGSGLLLFGQPEPRPENVPIVVVTAAMPGYFAAMRIPLVRGRFFTRDDTRESAPVAIIDEWTANRYWPGQNPIGQRFRNGRSQPWKEIVGVVGDVEAPVVIRFIKGRRQAAAARRGARAGRRGRVNARDCGSSLRHSRRRPADLCGRSPRPQRQRSARDAAAGAPCDEGRAGRRAQERVRQEARPPSRPSRDCSRRNRGRP